jgi:hypothetical protein
MSLWIEFVSVWLRFIFALGSFITDCFAEPYIVPEMTFDDRV